MIEIKTKNCNKDTKDKIIHLFYDKHKRPTDISKKLKVSMSYITKVIQKDNRYIEEKEKRKKINKEKNKSIKNRYIKNRRQQEKMLYQAMLIQINKDNEYLSTKKELSDVDFAKWNRGMYEYCKNSSDLKLKTGINVGYNVPRRIRNVVNASSIKV